MDHKIEAELLSVCNFFFCKKKSYTKKMARLSSSDVVEI